MITPNPTIQEKLWERSINERAEGISWAPGTLSTQRNSGSPLVEIESKTRFKSASTSNLLNLDATIPMRSVVADNFDDG
jgi:hypothetical protein